MTDEALRDALNEIEEGLGERFYSAVTHPVWFNPVMQGGHVRYVRAQALQVLREGGVPQTP